MQYVNDDMDDIFRKAAEGYPLDTSGADWNKVLAGLEGREEVKPTAKKRDHRRYLWLLMLLPMGLVCNYYYQQGKGTADQASSGKTPSIVTDPENATGGQGAHPYTNNSRTDNSGQTRTQVTQEGQPSVFIDHNEPGSNQTASGKFKARATTGAYEPREVSNKPWVLTNKNSAGQPATGTNDTDLSNPDAAMSMGSDASRTPPYTGFIDPDKFSLAGINIHPDAEFQQVSGSSQKANTIPNPKRFYVGLMGGLDRTTIEFQKTTRNGFDYGVLAGYKIGRKWSVEAAAFMDKKYYYTEGKYFKYEGYMPPNSWITDVDGYCRMWDISLGGTYSISQRNKSGWFAAAGISSYIMKKENYDYTYYYATSGVSAVHSKSYDKASKNLFSIVNLSLGYTHRLGKNTDLRVEPYTKVPIRGVGVGKLSLFSAGVHIGVTRKLF